ncbi:hypothetical protein [Pedomonas mirosovicensis]|uniref:hypothetical protein n=1 Tax=Pedomonas mirosovicensis TaxID=2908641 RepID=UPI00216874E0|nr:hypothetical protein [Pedomonas mirosovicensis]MCH8684452.1 hypothetical protein [Pedomonas mirosovicensis]
MPGFTKRHTKRDYGRAFPASHYNDPRGGRPSALERNILRYRAIEAALYLFYADEVRTFLLTDVYRAAVRQPGQSMWEQPEQRRLQGVFTGLLRDAESQKKIRQEDVEALRRAFEYDRQQGKKLKTAFAFAITAGLFTEAEASDLQDLLEYRNDIAHRIHLVMSDISRNVWTSDHLTYTAPTYKGDALERLRVYRRSLWERARGQLILTLSMDSMLFELAEHVFEQDLRRLDRIIAKQIAQDEERVTAINAELDLRGAELVGDLAPRFPANHRPSRSYGDDYIPASGHLTKRGVEICYRLFDLGKSPIAVAYLMGITLRSAERRQRSWIKAGGLRRVRSDVERYDLRSLQRLPSG